MLYIDGDNNLSTQAQVMFAEAARIGGSGAVHMTALLDLDGVGDTRVYDLLPSAKRTLASGTCLGGVCERDMGAQETLEEFIRWSERLHPAERYILILWDHGDGFQLVSESRDRRVGMDVCLPRPTYSGPPLKSICHDNNPNGRTLYNAQVADAIMRSPGKKVALLGMDACLMQMLETQYTVRSSAEVLVASEADETGYGWSYWWLRLLKLAPFMSAETLARLIVASYGMKYRSCDGIGKENRTLSAIRLSEINELAESSDLLADRLSDLIMQDRGLEFVRKARESCLDFGPGAEGVGSYSHIDLAKFCEVVATPDGADKEARAVVQAIRNSVIADYADRNAHSDDFGASGLAIFFPRTLEAFKRESGGAYDHDTPSYPGVPFVHDHKWSKFIKVYVNRAEYGH